MWLFIFFILLFAAGFSAWKAGQLPYPFGNDSIKEKLFFKNLTKVLQFLFCIGFTVVGFLLLRENFWLVILGIALVATPLVGPLIIIVANFLLIYPVLLPVAWLASRSGLLSNTSDGVVRENLKQKSVFKDKSKIAPDTAKVLFAFYEAIKKDKPNLGGKRLYETILATWNLNLSNFHIEAKKIIEKANHLDWGIGISLRKIAWAIAIEEYVKMDNVGSNFNKDVVLISKMRDEIKKIIPEGV